MWTENENLSNIKIKRNLLHLGIYLVIFFAVQSLYAYTYSKIPFLRAHVLPQTIIRLVTWTLPVLIYLLFSRTNPIEYLRLKRNAAKGLTYGLIIGAIIVFYNILSVYVLKGSIRFDFNISANNWINGIALVGFSEELLFRGFILRKLTENFGFWASNFINAALFALVHIIGWIILHEFVLASKAYSIVYLLLFSLVQGFILEKTDSLWSCIVVHSISNFISFVLVS